MSVENNISTFLRINTYEGSIQVSRVDVVEKLRDLETVHVFRSYIEKDGAGCISEADGERLMVKELLVGYPILRYTQKNKEFSYDLREVLCFSKEEYIFLLKDVGDSINILEINLNPSSLDHKLREENIEKFEQYIRKSFGENMIRTSAQESFRRRIKELWNVEVEVFLGNFSKDLHISSCIPSCVPEVREGQLVENEKILIRNLSDYEVIEDPEQYVRVFFSASNDTASEINFIILYEMDLRFKTFRKMFKKLERNETTNLTSSKSF